MVEINLPKASLQDNLNNFSFSSFPNLVRLNLSYNALSGTIRPNISALSRLSFLDLSDNKLSGTIPGEIGNMTDKLLTCPTTI